MTTAPTTSSRRSSEEIRRLLLESAREVFSEKGYARTNTREIADRVQVSEKLIFRHYQSKANLFVEAVLRPFNEFIDAFIAEWQGEHLNALPFERLVRAFLGHLYE